MSAENVKIWILFALLLQVIAIVAALYGITHAAIEWIIWMNVFILVFNIVLLIVNVINPTKE